MASWAWSWTRGYSYTTPDIISGPEVQKKKGVLNSEIWGPYKKVYVKSMFGQDLFTPPNKVDGVPILCRCRSIDQYVRSDGQVVLGAAGALLIASKRPACWEDSGSIMNPTGGDTFNVTVGHPGFYQYGASKDGGIGIVQMFFKGGKKRINRKGSRKTRKVKRRL